MCNKTQYKYVKTSTQMLSNRQNSFQPFKKFLLIPLKYKDNIFPLFLINY